MVDENETAAAGPAQDISDAVRHMGVDVPLPEAKDETEKEAAPAPEGTAGGAAETLAEAETQKAEAEKADAEGDKAPAEKTRKERRRDRWNEHTQRTKDAERAAREAKREAERLAKRLEEYEKPAPTLDDVDGDYDRLTAATAAHEVRQTLKAEREKDLEDANSRAQEAEQVATDAAINAFKAREADFASETPDYHETVNGALPYMTPQMGQAFAQAEKGPEVAYFLAKHPDELARIARLTDPTEVRIEMARLEGRISIPEPKRITTAPEPVRAVATGTGAQGGFNADNASVEELQQLFKDKGLPGFG